MNAKLVVAVFLVLQVSQAMCNKIPPAPQELIDKYNAMKTKFISRLNNMWSTINGGAQWLGAPVDEAANKMDKAVKVANVAGGHISKQLDDTRNDALAAYAYYARPIIGEPLQKALDGISYVLDQVMPAGP